MQETRVPSLGWEDPLEKDMTAHSSILAWESHIEWSLVGYSPWNHWKSGDNLPTKQKPEECSHSGIILNNKINELLIFKNLDDFENIPLIWISRTDKIKVSW